jgi:predicted aldo/keto reductase-like oxidoreductase
MAGAGATSPAKNHVASECTKCGRCETHCPQHISIMKELVAVRKRTGGFQFKIICAIAGRDGWDTKGERRGRTDE